MSDVLKSPEMLDWLRCQVEAVRVVQEWLRAIGVENDTARINYARSLFAQLAKAEIVVAWNRDE